jgi:putative DNA primase/helicase
VKRLLARAERSAREIESPPSDANSEVVERVKGALALWVNASPAEGSLVERYLGSRACTLTSAVKSADALRFHPFCPFRAERVPAMLALMRHVITDEPTGIHRTALAHGGQGKRNLSGGSKRMWGRSAQAAVKLQPHHGVLGIAEGIETAISASELFNVPVWALLSAGGIRSCPMIPGVRHLIIFADHDEVGLRAAEHCARRYSGNGVQATLRRPPTPDADYNDVQQEKKKCR